MSKPKSVPKPNAVGLAGIHTLVNKNNVRKDIDIAKEEKAIMGKLSETSSALDKEDLNEKYNRELELTSKRIGIELGHGFDNVSESGSSDSDDEESESGSEVSEISGSEASSDYDSEASSDASGSVTLGSQDSSTISVKRHRKHKKSKHGGSSRSSRSSRSSSRGSSRRSHKQRHKHTNDFVPKLPIDENYADNSTDLIVAPNNQHHMNNVMSSMHGEFMTSSGIESEKNKDIKARKLTHIAQLFDILQESGMKCNEVTRPTMDSSMGTIDSVLDILILKNDRKRYSTIADEICLGVAEGIESVFDGTREIPVLGWKPDYTGYHNTVNTKLISMKFETSKIVGEFIEQNKVGAMSRIAMEILPSFFIYPSQQRKMKNTPGYGDTRNLRNRIRSARESRRELNDL